MIIFDTINKNNIITEITYKNTDTKISLFLKEDEFKNLIHIFYITTVVNKMSEKDFYFQTSQENVPIDIAVYHHFKEMNATKKLPKFMMQYFFGWNNKIAFQNWLHTKILPNTLKNKEIQEYLSINDRRYSQYLRSILSLSPNNINFYEEFR